MGGILLPGGHGPNLKSALDKAKPRGKSRERQGDNISSETENNLSMRRTEQKNAEWGGWPRSQTPDAGGHVAAKLC